MLIALAVAALIAPEDPDGVVTTAPRGGGSVIVGAEAPTTDAQPSASQIVAATPHNLTTQEQIERWVAGRAAEPESVSWNRGQIVDDRQMHGFISGAIGTGDYSEVAMGVSLPIGETGRVDLAYSRTKNGWPSYGYGYGYPGDYGYGYGPRSTGLSDRGYGLRSPSSQSLSFGFSLTDENRRDRRANRPWDDVTRD